MLSPDTISAFIDDWTVKGNLAISDGMMDFAAARANMVESQVHTSGVTDHRILAAFSEVPREAFVPFERREIAYVDDDLLIKPANGCHQARFLMEPMVLARLIDLAEIRPGDKVLHIGCGTGYATAILARLAREVVAIDEDAELVSQAATLLTESEVRNVKVTEALHMSGAPVEAPFDVILIDGRIPAVPPSLLEQLFDGGRLVAVVGESAMASAMLYMRHREATSSRPAFEAAVRRLPGFTVERPAFVF
jgi:protein-L-isoaspartate(D-aspartate) O-methyltransferase